MRADEADAGEKAWWDGTHRTVPPAETLARLKPLLPAIGVTRVACQTGLDRVGIPVVSAIRPNSRSIAAHQGKGLGVEAAKASAIMEAAEAFHAENIRHPLRLARFEELAGRALDPARLPLTHSGKDPHAERILWVEGVDLRRHEHTWVPFELVSADYTYPQPAGSGLFQATTNGLGAGNHPLEAVTHALYEVVERDAIALWRAAPAHLKAKSAVDPASITDPSNRAVLERLEVAGLAVHVWEVTSDVGIPAYLCLIVPERAGDETEPELGSGCHVAPAVALNRAMTEAAQARLTRIVGARDDFIPDSYEETTRQHRYDTARQWRDLARTPGRPMAQAALRATLRDDLDHGLSRLEAAGLGRAVWVDLSWPEIGVPVGRLVVEGLEGPWTPPGGGYVPGARALMMGPGTLGPGP